MLIGICGKSGTGKSTLAKEIENLGYNKVVTDTTRPPRPGEEHGVDYYFDSDKDFNELYAEKQFIETSQYNTVKGVWRYGTTIGALDDAGDKAVIVLNPDGVKAFKKKKINIKIVLVETDENTILDRLCERGDNPQEVIRRMNADEDDFADIGKYVDYTVKNENGTDIKELAQEIVKLSER